VCSKWELEISLKEKNILPRRRRSQVDDLETEGQDTSYNLKHLGSVLNKTGTIHEDVCNKVKKERGATRMLNSVLRQKIKGIPVTVRGGP
jgi:hypothetical protein